MIQWKKIILSTIAAIGIACFAGGTADAASVKIDEKTFPDVCVRTAVAQYDKNKDGILSDQERDKVTGIDFDRRLRSTIQKVIVLTLRACKISQTSIRSIWICDIRQRITRTNTGIIALTI